MSKSLLCLQVFPFPWNQGKLSWRALPKQAESWLPAGKTHLPRELLEKGIAAGREQAGAVCGVWLSLFVTVCHCAAVPEGISPHLQQQVPQHGVGSAAPGEQTHHQTAHAEPQESQIPQPQVLIPPHLSRFSLLQLWGIHQRNCCRSLVVAVLQEEEMFTWTMCWKVPKYLLLFGFFFNFYFWCRYFAITPKRKIFICLQIIAIYQSRKMWKYT